jgi:capsular exopolysaccharide synthesis family protein
LLSPVSAGAQALAVTSAMSGEGKTVLASCLATSLAMAGRRVLLMDADMRRPQVHRTFDIVKAPGLSNVLAGEVKAPDAVRQTAVPGLSVLPAGDELPNAAELLDSEAFTALIEGFASRFDLVVLDCPPVMAVADATIVANATSAVLFVVGSGTAREVAEAAVDRLLSVHAQLVGVVLNKARHDRRFAYDRYLYHQPA